MVERVNKELKRRTKVAVAEIFPNDESLLRVVGSILMDINEEWVTSRKYLTMGCDMQAVICDCAMLSHSFGKASSRRKYF